MPAEATTASPPAPDSPNAVPAAPSASPVIPERVPSEFMGDIEADLGDMAEGKSPRSRERDETGKFKPVEKPSTKPAEKPTSETKPLEVDTKPPAAETKPPEAEPVIVRARGSGDDEIVRQAAAYAVRGPTLVVTADRELRSRCAAVSAAVTGPRWLLDLL